MHLSIYKALLSATEGIFISRDKIIRLYQAAVYSLCKTTDTHKRVERRERAIRHGPKIDLHLQSFWFTDALYLRRVGKSSDITISYISSKYLKG